MKFMRRTCKEVAALLIAREDKPLPAVERVALRLHLAACSACPVFQRQLSTMRNALERWRHYTDENQPIEPITTPKTPE